MERGDWPRPPHPDCLRVFSRRRAVARGPIVQVRHL